MSVMSKQELLYLAQRSKVGIEVVETQELGNQLVSVLEYVARVQEQSEDVFVAQDKPGILRADVIIPSDAQTLLNAAPAVCEKYFVVPRIIDIQ